MNTWKLCIGAWDEVSNMEPTLSYRRHITWFDEKTFKTREDLEVYRSKIASPNYAFSIQRMGILGEWYSDTWFDER